MNLKMQIHGLIFVAGEEGVSREELAQVLNADLESISNGLQQLKLDLQENLDSPIELVNYNQRYRLVTKKELESTLINFARSPFTTQLSRSAVETLAIIAYRQPITRMGVDQIRGVNSAAMIQRLLGRDLIKEVGRVEAPGRPILYAVTDYFMDYFGLNSLEDLPEIQALPLNSEESYSDLFNIKEWEVDFFDDEASTDEE
ncbi:SMC-Scp complex subunit ScpB [Fundicoccus culcitae]|uniref:Segregation and condensation protein B n=1 Tax=Fundicoccus culcitae TaxID=2969821 RepID=A0ABY5P7H1_9LACT|nr:SMC-Scp complex subunit ScpB [Fundicoccus culcitae]UUX34546.1 SMC-Scp complex subunit ScpB [Fundicoccus culcitae]